MATKTIGTAGEGRWAKLRTILGREFREMLPPTIFFFIGFNLILFTKRLLLADYLIQFSGFMVATTSALVVGKTVLVADMMPFMRRFDYAPLAQPILFKTVVYTVLVSAVRLLEALVHYLFVGGTVGSGGFLEDILGTFRWDHFIAVQLWVFVLFLIYVTASEINDLLGDGELFKLFFVRRSSELKSTRRSRIRLLTRLSRLTEAHSIDELSDRTTAAHTEMASILLNLSRGKGVGGSSLASGTG